MFQKGQHHLHGLGDVSLNVFERDSNFSVKEGDIGGVLAHLIEDDLLVFQVLGSVVGKRWWCSVVGRVRGKSGIKLQVETQKKHKVSHSFSNASEARFPCTRSMLAMSVEGPLVLPPGSSRPRADHPVDQSEGVGSDWTGAGGLKFPVGLGSGVAGRRFAIDGGIGACWIGTEGGAFLRVLVVGGSGECLWV